MAVVGVACGVLATAAVSMAYDVSNFAENRDKNRIGNALKVPEIAVLKRNGYEIVSLNYSDKLKECEDSGMVTKVEKVIPQGFFTIDNAIYAIKCDLKDTVRRKN